MDYRMLNKNTYKTSLKADKEVAGCLGAAFGFAFFDGGDVND